MGLSTGTLGGLGVCYLVISTRVKELINSEFLNASRVIGASELQIALRHILPLIIPYSVALMLSVTTSGIVAYGFASFLDRLDGLLTGHDDIRCYYLWKLSRWNKSMEFTASNIGFIFSSSSFYLISIQCEKTFGISL